jgi:di/tricarboxylate transporter
VTNDQILIISILMATVAMFLWGRWRHDMVAAGALLACVLTGLVSYGNAFDGFSHPAVITVACVLVLSKGLQNSGAVDVLVRYIMPASAGPTLTIAALTGIAAVLSGFMNNVGALALLMPLAMQVATRQGLPPGRVLMPLAFGSILGGMTTMIGTPPNLVVSGFRAQNGLGSFTMFDFTPVGVAVAAVGVVFVALVGWRLVPARKSGMGESFDMEAYLTEARVQENSKAAGATLGEIETTLDEADAQVIGLVRNEVRLTAPTHSWVVHPGDILVIEAKAEALSEVLSSLGLKLEESKRPEPEENGGDQAGKKKKNADKKTNGDEKEETPVESKEIVLMEFAVLPGSSLVGLSASDILLRTRYGINLLAVSRQGRRSMARLRTIPFKAGDVLLMQGPSEALFDFASNAGCVPLAERSLRIPSKRKAMISGSIMALAVGGAAFGLLPAAVSFAAGVLASMAFRTVSPRAVYDAIDWPVIVLLAALIPVAGAMESTGAAELIARFILESIAQGHAIVGLAVILVVTMTFSAVLNNTATAAVMCPIALGTAGQLGLSADPFLMAVAVGASCAFITPISHQNNTLILGPGGFRFGDYWPLGLPLQILALVVGIPMLLWVWPL